MNDSINDRLRNVIKHFNKSQADFADSIGTTAATLSRQLKGIHKIDKQVALSIQAVYGINHTWLLTGEGDMFLNNPPYKETPVYTFEEIDKTWDKKKSPEEEAEFKALVGKGLYPIDEDNIHHTVWFNKLNKFQQWLVAAINTRGILDDDMLKRLRTWIEMENEMKEAIDKNQSDLNKKGEAG